MITRKSLCLLAALCLLVVNTVSVFAQSVYFTSPQNGAIIDTSPGGNSAVVYVDENWDPSSWSIAYDVVVWVDENSYPVGGYGQYFSVGTHSAHAELWETNNAGQEFKTAEADITFEVRKIYRVLAKNSFNAGSLKVNGNTVNNSYPLDGPSGTQFNLDRCATRVKSFGNSQS